MLKGNANGKMFSFQPAFLLHLEPFANSLKQCSRSYDGSDILLADFSVAVAVLETVPIMRRGITCIGILLKKQTTKKLSTGGGYRNLKMLV